MELRTAGCGRVPDRRRRWLIDRAGVGGANNGSVRQKWIPCDTNAWFEVRVVLPIDPVEIDTDPHQRCAGGLEHHEPVVPLGRRDVPLVAHPELERERVEDSDVVLDEQGHRPLIDDASPIAERGVERVRDSREERVHAREVEHPGALGKVR